MKPVYASIVLVIALCVSQAPDTVVAFSNALDGCPKLLITCPDELPEAGKTYAVTLRVQGADEKKLSYKWSVSNGEIVDGQGTPTLRVRFTKPETSFTATVEVGGLPPDCENTVSCTFAVS